jgi:serine/threonine-protein kinase
VTIQIGDVVGDYKVIGIAGSGGMGAVYKIEHIITRRIEAMKLLPPGLSTEPEQVQRFEREIQVQARLHHPNIVALYNAVRTGGSVALVMEFVEGESLQKMMEGGALPVKTALAYTSQVLAALAYAHEAGVIHRDVAPANIIITQGRTVKLTDFGLARAETDLRLTSSGVPVGSPWYMSPEQVRGIGIIDARSDLYAVGAVLHEMLTGKKLFDVDGAFAVMRAQVEATPKLPSAWNRAVPPVVDEIVRRALAKDPANRFQSAEEFRAAVEIALFDSAPVGAPLAAPIRLTAAPQPVAAPAPAQLSAPAPLTSSASFPLPAPLAVGLASTVPPEEPPRARLDQTVRAAVARWTAGLAGFRLTRTAMLAALVPVALIAGYFAVRPGPRTAQGATAAPPIHQAPLPQAESPAQPTAESTPPLPEPSSPEPTIPKPIATDAPKPLPAVRKMPLPVAQKVPQATTQKMSQATVPPRVQKPVNKPQPSVALRVTGGEIVPANAMPAPAPAATETPSAKSDAVELPAPPPVPVATAPVPESAPLPAQGAEPAKPQKGSRLVRALGKIFKKPTSEGDASKTPAKKD